MQQNSEPGRIGPWCGHFEAGVNGPIGNSGTSSSHHGGRGGGGPAGGSGGAASAARARASPSWTARTEHPSSAAISAAVHPVL